MSVDTLLLASSRCRLGWCQALHSAQSNPILIDKWLFTSVLMSKTLIYEGNRPNVETVASRWVMAIVPFLFLSIF